MKRRGFLGFLASLPFVPQVRVENVATVAPVAPMTEITLEEFIRAEIQRKFNKGNSKYLLEGNGCENLKNGNP